MAGVFTNWFGLIDNINSGIITTGDNGDIRINVPTNASEEEKLAYAFIELNAGTYQIGLEFDVMGKRCCADSIFAMVLTNVSSMRYAVDSLLEMKGTTPAEDGRLRDWDSIAAMSWTSPFPYLFEGAILEANGDNAGAAECYRKAALNPNLLEDGEQFKDIAGLDKNALERLKTVLEELEDTITAYYGHRFINIPRDEKNFDVEYLRQKAMECLEREEEDLLGALSYYQAALQNNPFDGDNYANLVGVCMYIGDGEILANYLIDGLSVDPENVRLAYLLNMMKEAIEQ